MLQCSPHLGIDCPNADSQNCCNFLVAEILVTAHLKNSPALPGQRLNGTFYLLVQFLENDLLERNGLSIGYFCHRIQRRIPPVFYFSQTVERLIADGSKEVGSKRGIDPDPLSVSPYVAKDIVYEFLRQFMVFYDAVGIGAEGRIRLLENRLECPIIVALNPKKKDVKAGFTLLCSRIRNGLKRWLRGCIHFCEIDCPDFMRA